VKTDLLKEYVIREEVLKLLSDEEIAQVSLTETASRLHDGEEYLDLEQTVQGVRRAVATALPVGRVLPRAAVHATTWGKILALVSNASRSDASHSREP
jgi:hypothetical protein